MPGYARREIVREGEVGMRLEEYLRILAWMDGRLARTSGGRSPKAFSHGNKTQCAATPAVPSDAGRPFLKPTRLFSSQSATGNLLHARDFFRDAVSEHEKGVVAGGCIG